MADWDWSAPCIGCTEKAIAFRVPMFQVVQLHTIAAPPTAFAPISTTYSTISPLATGLVGNCGGSGRWRGIHCVTQVFES
jgi:hypothetical protein